MFHIWGAVKRKPNTYHKTHSLQKLAALLLHINTAICRVRDMHSENTQVQHSCLCIAVEVSLVYSVFVQHWKWRQAKRCSLFLGGWGCWNSSLHACCVWWTLYMCARVAEESPRRMHITAKRFVPGTGPLSHYTWCECMDWWSDPKISTTGGNFRDFCT